MANRTPKQRLTSFYFNIQKQLPGNLPVDVAYAGSHGVKFPIGLSMRQFPPSLYGHVGGTARVAELARLAPNPSYGIIKTGTLSSATTQQANLLRPYPHYTGDSTARSAGNATYRSFQLRGVELLFLCDLTSKLTEVVSNVA